MGTWHGHTGVHSNAHIFAVPPYFWMRFLFCDCVQNSPPGGIKNSILTWGPMYPFLLEPAHVWGATVLSTSDIQCSDISDIRTLFLCPSGRCYVQCSLYMFCRGSGVESTCPFSTWLSEIWVKPGKMNWFVLRVVGLLRCSVMSVICTCCDRALWIYRDTTKLSFTCT